jgi:hypothetical protein
VAVDKRFRHIVQQSRGPGTAAFADRFRLDWPS